MLHNLGKWFYVSSFTEAEKAETSKLLRVMRVRKSGEGKEVCETELYTRAATSDRDDIGPTVDKNYLLEHYTAISPQLVTYWVVFKDAPVFHSLYIVFEPYDLEDKQTIGAAISVYPAMSTLYGITPHIFTCHKRMDAVEYFRDMRGYQKYETGPAAAVYYSDTASTLLALSLYDWENHAPYRKMLKLTEYRDSFAALSHVDIDPQVKHNTMSTIFFLRSHLMRMHQFLLHIMPISHKEITTLCEFVKDHNLEKENTLLALTNLLRFELKTDSIYQEDVIADQAFLKSLIVMPYSMEMDLAKIKTNNPLYTLVLAKTIEVPTETYVIMYRRSPVEFRTPNQTGFSPDEIIKLLR